ncbi:MAG: class I SAM-dependent methyltransferase [Tabrizicola sp.]|nr:class I SAM-dependent methyltransferase [Tabrizicola sp.]
MKTVYRPLEHFCYAEFGIWKADTAANVCKLFPNATLFLFDFEDNIRAAQEKLSVYPNRVHYFGNSQRYNDSYNWALGKLVAQNGAKPIFDYCFLDGAHTYAVDALNFFLCDRLLRVDGYMDFDDYSWTLRGSSLDPSAVPEMLLQYTEEQIDSLQVKMIVDDLVKTDSRYVEKIANKVYQKLRA